MTKKHLFWLIAFVFIGAMLWAIYDIMHLTTTPWERKKQREAAQKQKKNAMPEIVLFQDTIFYTYSPTVSENAAQVAERFGVEPDSLTQWSPNKPKQYRIRIRAMHTLKAHETWETVADWYKVEVRKLRAANPTVRFVTDEKLIIPLP